MRLILKLNCIGKTVVLSFTYELKKKKKVQYKANYKFDVVRKGNRSIWIHKEEPRVHSNKILVS